MAKNSGRKKSKRVTGKVLSVVSHLDLALTYEQIEIVTAYIEEHGLDSLDSEVEDQAILALIDKSGKKAKP